MSREPDDDLDDEYECWCGAKGKRSEMFGREVFLQSCGGTETLYCRCGGDQCFCHYHGEVECPGCEDCKSDDFDDDEDYYGDEDYR